MSAPCKQCAERHLKCHTECMKYKQFLVENEATKNRRRLYGEAVDMDISNSIKIRKKRHVL